MQVSRLLARLMVKIRMIIGVNPTPCPLRRNIGRAGQINRCGECASDGASAAPQSRSQRATHQEQRSWRHISWVIGLA
jgi:hypothetical protein